MGWKCEPLKECDWGYVKGSEWGVPSERYGCVQSIGDWAWITREVPDDENEWGSECEELMREYAKC